MYRPSRSKRIREEKMPEPGKYFDVVSLLSSYGGDLIRKNGDRVALGCDTFKGKHVMVCCFHVPVITPYTKNFRSLINLCNELYSSRKEKDDFEMVVVASMEDDDKEAFDHLFSRFPKSCLAVPFENWKTHDLCKVLGLGVRGRHTFECVFVNAEGKVSPFSSFNNYCNMDIFADYGAEAFPFSEEVIKERDEECQRVVFEESSSLEAVLRCNDSSPDYVYKFGGGERLHISQLSNKHVGLLLCCTGDLIYHLVKQYEQCREKKFDFEVVVVYSPTEFFMDKSSPQRFKKEIDGILQGHINTCGRWWCLPFNNSVSKRFWRMTRRHSTFQFWDHGNRYDVDKLIVVGPGVKHLDMYGGEVMKCQGIDGYPFTTDAAIANKMKKLKEFTLQSLFAGTEGVTRGDDRQGRAVPVGEVEANKVFLLFLEVDGDFDLTSVPVYLEMKDHFGYELVLVKVGPKYLVPEEEQEVQARGVILYTCPITGFRKQSQLVSDEERREIESEMPWYICPINKPMMELMRVLGKSSRVLVGFGDDGRVCSLSFGDRERQVSLQDMESGNTLYDDVEKLLGYNRLKNRRMQHL